MLNEPDQSELYGWLRFIGRRIMELVALAAWCLGVWAFHVYIVKNFPLDSKSEVAVQISECMLDVAAILQLVKLLFFHHNRKSTTPWWR